MNKFRPTPQKEPLLREHQHDVKEPMIKVPWRKYLQMSRSTMGLSGILVVLLTLLWYTTVMSLSTRHHVFTVDSLRPVKHITSDKFLSFGLDTSLLVTNFGTFNMTDQRVIKMVSLLSPANLRFGGTMADQLLFTEYSRFGASKVEKKLPNFDDSCIYEENDCATINDTDIVIMNGDTWRELNTFVQKTNLTLLFDLNVLIRKNDSWDPSNAETIINFSDRHKFDLNWQLGNEPNSFKHVFGTPVNASQLGLDYIQLRNLLNKYPKYNRSLVTGPDVTRPLANKNTSVDYLREFLKTGKDAIDVVSWHQYYLNGREATLDDFLNPDVFNLLSAQIKIVQETVKDYGQPGMDIWLSETGSAYGGGAPGLSDSFAGSFLWLDKLGTSAQLGLKSVIRQSLYGKYYAMIDEELQPLPDWWVAILYKTFVDIGVLHTHGNSAGHIRLYAHCTPKKTRMLNMAAVTVYGMNLKASTEFVSIRGITNPYKAGSLKTIFGYHLTAPDIGDLKTKTILLNGTPLKLLPDGSLPQFVPEILTSKRVLRMPPYSIVFWVLHGVFAPACF